MTSKVVALLEAFSPTAPELSLNALARESGLPLSTAYRLASELVDCGLLERNKPGSYRIGLRVWEIGSLAPRGLTIRDVALPFMQELHKSTGENIHLAIRDGYEALYVTRISGKRSVAAKGRIGGRLPLYATGVGKVLLAYSSPEFIQEVVERGLTRYTPHTVVAPGQLMRMLAGIRRTGVAVSNQELTIGTVSIASPVFDASESIVAALAVVVRSAHADIDRLAPAVRMTALGISRESRARAVTPGDGDGRGPAHRP